MSYYSPFLFEMPVIALAQVSAAIVINIVRGLENLLCKNTLCFYKINQRFLKGIFLNCLFEEVDFGVLN